MNIIRKFLIENYPSLGKYKRSLTALIYHLLPKKKGYSQHKEDEYIIPILKKINLDNSIFVDIGANHPMDISNTYLMYRNGLRGIVIDPNTELIKLHKIYRKHDIQINVGCGSNTSIEKFIISNTPVLSSFTTESPTGSYDSYYMPILRLDDVLKKIDFEYINLLSIDVEGLNYEALLGSENTVSKTLLVCIEYDADENIPKIKEFLGEKFEMIKKFEECNLLFLNKEIAKKYSIN